MRPPKTWPVYLALVAVVGGLVGGEGCRRTAPAPKAAPKRPVVSPVAATPAGLKPALYPQLPFDLAKAAGQDQLTLAPAERKRLAEHGFLLGVPEADRMASCYRGKLPPFITVDAVADQFLRDFEDAWAELEWEQQARLFDFQQKLWDGVFGVIPFLGEGELAEAGKRLLGLLSVARRTADPEWSPPLDGPDTLDKPEWVAAVTREWRALETGEGPAESALWKRKIDWAALQPVGLYAQTEDAGRFYRVRSWWRQYGFRSSDRQDRLCLIILIWSMHQELLVDLPENASPLDWRADEAGPYEQAIQMETAYDRFLGQSLEMPLLTLLDAYVEANEKGEFETIEAAVEKWEQPLGSLLAKQMAERTRAGLPVSLGTDGQPCLEVKLCPRRLSADERSLLRLATPQRPLPRGLDLLAAFGQQRARELALAEEPAESRDAFARQIDQVADQTPVVEPVDQTLGCQPCLRRMVMELAEPNADPRLPLAMRTTAWNDRQLVSALGLWAGLREVYSPPFAPLDEPPEVEALPGIVEPQLEGWQRLVELWFAADAAFKWSDVELSNESLYWALNFRRIARKQLRGEPLTEDEEAQFGEFALLLAEREHSENRQGVDDRSAALIARGGSPLRQRVAGKRYAQLYIVLEYEGTLHICQGGVFDYVETELPGATVVTPDVFRALLDSDHAPKPPAWSEGIRD